MRLAKSLAASGRLQARAVAAIETSMYAELHHPFTEVRAATESVGRIMPCNWTGIPERLAGARMVYSSASVRAEMSLPTMLNLMSVCCCYVGQT